MQRESETEPYACTRDKNNASRASCENLKPLFEALRMLHVGSLRHLRSIIDHIFELLPESYANRQQRGIFDLGGQILNSLFGVATDKQLNALRATAIHSYASNAKALNAWQQHADQLSSFMAVSNTCFDNLASVVSTQQAMVTQLHHATVQLNSDLATLQTLVTHAIVNITDFISALNEVDDLRIATEGLVHGQLSPVILPLRVIEDILTEIHHSLPNSLTTLFLEKLPAEYYCMHNFVVARQDNNLLLALCFPLCGIPIDYTFYEFQTFPIPVQGLGNDDHVTEITDLPYGIAFHPTATTRGQYYFLFPSKPDFIDNDFFYAISPSEPIRSFIQHNTCASALVVNERQLVVQLCKFQLRPTSLAPNIIPLSRSTILVTNVSSLEYICDRRHVEIKGCLQCQLTIVVCKLLDLGHAELGHAELGQRDWDMRNWDSGTGTVFIV